MGNVSKPIVQKIDEQVLRWFGHVERMSNERIVKQVYESEYSGRRARGRPRRVWLDNVKEHVNDRALVG